MKYFTTTKNITILQISLLIVLGLVIAGGVIMTLYYNQSFGKALAHTKEEIRPSKIEIQWLTDSECPQCSDFQPFIDILNNNQDTETIVNKIEWNSDAGNKLIKEYEITKVPNLVITGETKRKNILADWEPLGKWQNDAFVFTSIKAPYRETDTQVLRGEFDLTYVIKTDCDECYEVTVQNSALSRFGMTPQQTHTIIADSDEGKSYIEKYGIKKLPTMVLTGDLQAFPQLLQVWPQVGDVASDGAYVFRQVELMGNYWDLESDELIQVQ